MGSTLYVIKRRAIIIMDFCMVECYVEAYIILYTTVRNKKQLRNEAVKCQPMLVGYVKSSTFNGRRQRTYVFFGP